MSKKKLTHIIPLPAQNELTELGKRLRMERKSLKWTLASLSVRCNCSVPTLRALESGKGTVSISVLMNVLWCISKYKDLAKLCLEKPVEKPADKSWMDGLNG